MGIRPKLYSIDWPLTADKVQNIDEMFEVLFDDIGNDVIFPVTTEGDLMYRDEDRVVRLGIGDANTVLRTDGVVPEWGKVDIAADSDTVGILSVAQGGTGESSFGVGDLLHAAGATDIAGLADVATGNALLSGGIGVAPAYGKVGLTTHVSGTLPIANGGTNSTATPTDGGIVFGDGTAYQVTAQGVAAQVLTSNGASPPTWEDATGGGADMATVMTRVVLGI